MHDCNPNSLLWSYIAQQIREPVISVERRASSGFTRTFVICCETHRFFVKLSDDIDCLYSEEDGLNALLNTRTIRVPEPVAGGKFENIGFLVTEYLQFQPASSSFAQFAVDLVNLHRSAGSTFGWHRDNYIGGSQQINSTSNDWIEFFRDNRLGYQFNLALENGYARQLSGLSQRVLDRLPAIMGKHHPEPSLVHGDLWRGNCGFLANDVAVIYDPAVYYGDRETDLAMTRLFGQFPNSFYQAYQEMWPMEQGWELRQHAYNLYHILNHLNLFGATYLHQAETMAQRLLKDS